MKLKHELYVTYSASEDGPDRTHFDNPVYSQSIPTANNVKNIHNNLNNQKSNIQKAKLAYVGEDFSGEGASGAAQTHNDYAEVDEKSQKLRESALNPNIYHSIEDLKQLVDKKEPFYDEIRRRSGEGLYGFTFRIPFYFFFFLLSMIR